MFRALFASSDISNIVFNEPIITMNDDKVKRKPRDKATSDEIPDMGPEHEYVAGKHY